MQEGTGTVKLRATVPNRERRLWPGRFVNVRLILGQIAGAVLVPAIAPQNSAKGLFVYVVKDDGTADLRPVTLGQRQGDLVIVSAGVKPGERVVTNGQMGVMPGGKVRIEASGEPGEAGRARGRPEAMNLSEPFIRRPVMTAVLTASVILFGVLSYRQLPGERPARRRLPGHPGAGRLPGRQPGHDGEQHRDAARAPVHADHRPRDRHVARAPRATRA